MLPTPFLTSGSAGTTNSTFAPATGRMQQRLHREIELLELARAGERHDDVRVADVDALAGAGDVESPRLDDGLAVDGEDAEVDLEPRSLRVRVLMPARVPMRSGAASMSARPCRRGTSRRRVPLPHISAAEPSALR
jgi:hypothetical protein